MPEGDRSWQIEYLSLSDSNSLILVCLTVRATDYSDVLNRTEINNNEKE